MLTFHIVGPPERMTSSFRNQLLARLAAYPGIEAAAFTNVVPMSASGGRVHLATSPVAPSGPPPPPLPGGGSTLPQYPAVRCVSGDYLRATGTRLLEGRGFTSGFDSDHAREALINRTLASIGYLGSAPIGTHVYVGSSAPLEIVGIVEESASTSASRSIYITHTAA